MSSDHPSPSGSELLPADEVSVAQNGNDWRPCSEQARDRSTYRLRLTIAWTALLLFGSTLIWSLTWIKPQPAVRVSLIGASYAENLSVNHNLYGWKDLQSLASTLEVDPHLDRVQLSSAPIDFHHDTRWDAGLSGSDQDTIVLYFSVHGVSEKSQPYLLPMDCSATQKQGLAVRSVVERLAKLPASQKKLLVLDASHFQLNWQYGVLHNDFVRSLKTLEQEIASVPNLIVFCATDENQRSWESALNQRTAFGHFLQEGLRGAAKDGNQNGRLDAEDLFRFTQQSVSHWVQTAYGQTQEPILLPSGKEGLARASRVELASVNRNYQAPVSSKPVALGENQLKKIWQVHHQLSDQSVKPYAYWPGQWRLYERAILRYESLVQADELVSANRVLELISSLQHQFQWEQQRSNAAQQGNLFLGKALLGVAADHAQAQKITDQLWAAEPDQLIATWQKELTTLDASAGDLLRVEVLLLLYERAADDPIGQLAHTATIVEAVLDPAEPPSAAINFLLMLNRYLPDQLRSRGHADLLRQALEVRLLAEQVAVAYQSDLRGGSEAVIPWILAPLKSGDRNRRLGEDLLFAGPAQKQEALQYFQQARRDFQKAQQYGSQVRDAHLLSQQLSYQLPWLAQWVVGSSIEDTRENRQRRSQLEDLLGQAHRLQQMLEQPNPGLLTSSSESSSSYNASSLAHQTAKVDREFSLVNQRFETWWNDQIGAQTPDLWHDISLALSLPYGQPQTRITLLLNQANLEQATPMQSQLDFSPTATEAANGHGAKERASQEALHRAIVQGQMALAQIGEQAFQQVTAEVEKNQPGSAHENFEQFRHRLSLLTTDQAWCEPVEAIGLRIGEQLNQLLQAADKATERPGVGSLPFLASVHAQWSGYNQRPSSQSPNAMLRDRRQSSLLTQLANRTLEDHWLDGDGNPYFQQMGRRYQQTAARLWPNNPDLTSLDQQLATAGQLSIQSIDQLNVTTEKQLTFEVGLQMESQSYDGSGFPILWLESRSAMSLARPLDGQRLVQRLTDGQLDQQEACLLSSPEDIEAGSKSTQRSNGSLPVNMVSFRKNRTDEGERLQIEGFFRGQRLSKSVAIQRDLIPSIRQRNLESPDTARLAVVASSQVQGLFGSGSGAVAIVLDASGSMGAAPGKSFGPDAKYAEALRALGDVLAELPDGIQLSIWVFGQATGQQKTVRHAEDTIRQMVPPTIWNTRDQGQAAELLKRLAWPNVEPWNESPIVDAVLAAKQDVISHAGFKTVVLLTDGMDNRYQQKNGVTDTVPEALKSAFDNSGVVLNVVGFKVASREQKTAQSQFQHVESFQPPGRYFEVSDAQVLADVLKSVLHQRIRYWVEDYRHQPILKGRQPVEASSLNSGWNWYPMELKPGNYRLRTNITETAFPFVVQKGDRLVLGLDRTDDGVLCRTLPQLESQYSQYPNQRTADWRVAVLQNRFLEAEQKLALSVGIENVTTAATTNAALIRPAEVWFEVESKSKPGQGQPVIWSADQRYPLPVYQLQALGWKREPAEVPPPVVRMWWSPDQATPAAVRLERGRDFQKVTELAGQSIDVNGTPVLIEAIQVQERIVAVGREQDQKRSCLVIRLKHDPQQTFWARPYGFEFEGREELSYSELGSYTGVFWPITSDEVEQVISRLCLVSLDDLKQQAEHRKCQLKLDQLSAPRADDITMPPITDAGN